MAQLYDTKQTRPSPRVYREWVWLRQTSSMHGVMPAYEFRRGFCTLVFSYLWFHSEGYGGIWDWLANSITDCGCLLAAFLFLCCFYVHVHVTRDPCISACAKVSDNTSTQHFFQGKRAVLGGPRTQTLCSARLQLYSTMLYVCMWHRIPLYIVYQPTLGGNPNHTSPWSPTGNSTLCWLT